MSHRMDRALTAGLGVSVVLLLAGLGGGGRWATWAGLLVLGVVMVIGAISLVHGGRVGDDDHRRAGPGADDRGGNGLGCGDRRGGHPVRGGKGSLGGERAWRAWLDEMEEKEK